MQSRVCIFVLLLSSCLLVFADHARAWPPRLRLFRNRGGGASSGSVSVAPKIDAESSGYRPLRVYFGYEQAKTLDAALADRIRVFLRVREEQIADLREGVVAEVKLTDLSNSATSHVKWCPVSFDRNAAQQSEQLATFEVTNASGESLIQPQKVYRLFVNLHRKSAEDGQDSVLGRVPGPYYVATSSSTLLQKARQQIAMRTFREWYCTERGWPRDGGYRMDCHAYYLWATGSHTVGANRGQANLARLFRVFRSGSEIRQLHQESPIHGDYVRIPGHTFMLLAYDEHLGKVWTMEGNFGSSIEIALRSVGAGWQVGHLGEEDIRADVFEQDDAAVEAGDALAAGEPAEQPALP